MKRLVIITVGKTHSGKTTFVLPPTSGEADYLFAIKDSNEIQSIIQKITYIAQSL
ncbi:hypothetical protein [Paenibacillus sp. YN15]|uniref:hypothetical protein n=1 Tax=Paenibacillus sp. YN15 TaxID=1742774 RepID=UPI0015EC7DF9|nr:hypothetical protein [Paenibacillus sp. YN15]